jgi:hypothetical protein
MLIPRQAESAPQRRQGGRRTGIAELRRQLASPSVLTEGHRQRLLELAKRLARVQALGDEYARVELSSYVAAALGRPAAAV